MTLLNRVKLKDIEEEDLEQILNWRNKENIREVMFNSNLIELEQHIRWFKELKSSKTSLSKIFYFDGTPYGVLNINKIDKINNKCEWGFYIGDSNAPRGMGTILGFTSLNYIFSELLIRKVSAEVLGINNRSLTLHQKLHFKKDGVLRKHILKNNVYMDIILFSIFKDEWEKFSVDISKFIEGTYL